MKKKSKHKPISFNIPAKNLKALQEAAKRTGFTVQQFGEACKAASKQKGERHATNNI